MNDKGFAELPNFIAVSELQRMQAFVQTAVTNSDGAYAGFTGPDDVVGSGLEIVARSPQFRELMERVYEISSGKPALHQDYYQILRC